MLSLRSAFLVHVVVVLAASGACEEGEGAPADVAPVDATVGSDVAAELPPPVAPTPLGPRHELEGARMPQDEEAIATTDDGWVVALVLARQALTTVGEELAPTAPEPRVALLPVAADGTPGRAVEVVAHEHAVDAAVTTCAGRLWGAAQSSDQRASWVFRAAPDLSDLEVMSFEATGTAGSESSSPRASVRSVSCLAGAPAFVLHADGPSRIVGPSGAVLPAATGEGEAWYLVDAAPLFDAGRVAATGAPGVFIDDLAPGAGGAIIYSAFDVGGERPTAVRVMRHDLATGTSAPFVAPPLPPHIFGLRFAEALDGPDAGRLQVVCARANEPVDLDGVRVTDPLAADFCVTFRDGRYQAHRTLRGVVLRSVLVADGLVWIAGSAVDADPVLGEVAGGAAGFLVGLDPATMEPRASTRVDAAGTLTAVRALLPAQGGGACPSSGVVLETVSAPHPDVPPRTLDVRAVMLAADGASCRGDVVVADGSDGYLWQAPLFGTRGPTCSEARRLALLPPDTRLRVAAGELDRVTGALGLQAFAPAACAPVP